MTGAYGATAFTQGSTNPSVYVTAFGKVDKVAPMSIEPDVRVLKNTFETIQNDPSVTLSASVAGLSAESAVASWTRDHCEK